MKEEEEQTEINKYINENIIDKGYDPEDVASFVMKTRGVPFESLSLDKLKEVVEEFKDKGLNDAYTSVKQKEKKSEKNEKEKQKDKNDKSVKVDYSLYAPALYEFETDTQQENKLVELYKNNTMINITVSEPKKEGKGGFFSKPYWSYRVQCPQLNSDVRRTAADFDWFRNQLIIRYSLRHVPPIVKDNVLKQLGTALKLESEEAIEQRKLRYYNQFLECLIEKKIFRTSPILYEFLVLTDSEKFKKYQNKLNNSKFELSIKLSNLITLKGKIKCELKEDSISEANKMAVKFYSLSDVYSKIDSLSSNISSNFQTLHSNFKHLSLLFSKLLEILTQNQYNNTESMKKNYTDFRNIFENWSNSFKKQSEYFNKEFKETFSYLGAEVNEMNSVYKKYVEFKNEYESFTNLVNKKKEDLFTSKKYQNWNVEPGTEDDIPTYKDDKKIAFEKMCYRENYLLKEEKKRVCASIHFMNKQFDKLMRNESIRMQKYFISVQENSKLIFGHEQILKELLESSPSEKAN